jgi:putative acetyltransferase
VLKVVSMYIRKYEPSDCFYLYRLFFDTVHSINLKDYNEQQVNAWATNEVDLEKMNRSFMNHITLVVVSDDCIVGFGDIDQTGYLDYLYVHKDYQRQGIATMLCDELEKNVINNVITTHASITAKPFFMKRGYNLIKEQQVERKGIFLTNFVMEKCL